MLKQKEKLGGIRGAVLELIATEQKYETAIEIALGAAAQRRCHRRRAGGAESDSIFKTEFIRPRDVPAAYGYETAPAPNP